MKTDKIKKVFTIIGDILVYLYAFIALFCVIVSITSKKDSDGATVIFNHEIRTVLTESMEKNDKTWDTVKNYKIKNIDKDSLVFIELVDEDNPNEWYSNLKVGDVLTFKYYILGQQVTITHRISSITENSTNDGYLISLKGDNNEDQETSQTLNTAGKETLEGQNSIYNYVIGKVVYKSDLLGFLVTGFKKPIVIVLIIIVPCVIVIVLEVIKIAKVLSLEKKKQTTEKIENQANEIEELKKQLEELKSKQNEIKEEDTNG